MSGSWLCAALLVVAAYLIVSSVIEGRRLKKEQDNDLMLLAKTLGWLEKTPDEVVARIEKELKSG